jgi:DNA-binding transcriptional LysR family regulator
MSDNGTELRIKAERDRWLAIEMRHLAALATVSSEASFSGAADSLGYVQSAISQQIAYLERVVGRRLVERSGRRRSVTLTEAGAVLLDHIEQILEQLRFAKGEVDAVTRCADAPVSFGMSAIFGTWLPPVVLRACFPDAGAAAWGRIDRGPSSQLLEEVAAGHLDAAFVELPIASGPFFAMELLREPYVLVFPAEGAVGDDSVESVLGSWPIVAVDDCRATQSLQMLSAAGSQTLRTAHAVDSPGSALSFVRSRVAAAVMTCSDVPAEDASLATVDLPGVPDRVLGLAWHRDQDDSPVIEALRAAARRAFETGRQRSVRAEVDRKPAR